MSLADTVKKLLPEWQRTHPTEAAELAALLSQSVDLARYIQNHTVLRERLAQFKAAEEKERNNAVPSGDQDAVKSPWYTCPKPNADYAECSHCSFKDNPWPRFGQETIALCPETKQALVRDDDT